ncbi:outer membrane protein OmpK [Enterobacter hormaechei]|uniref:outer membrane protein OmpK n=1 Tax=Enterobacter hormaechei TaxID=158836 RepID=UPI003712C65F|nr:outer membrane protein OmpK [Enterobacter hormaechei subsp. xiangfangensis]
MKKMKYLLPGALIMLPFIAFADSGNNEYLSDWWHQSINIVGSNSTRFGPQKRSDLYPEYRAWAHVDWFDFYGYADLPKEGANKRGNSSRLTQSFHFFMFEPIFSPVNALNQPI